MNVEKQSGEVRYQYRNRSTAPGISEPQAKCVFGRTDAVGQFFDGAPQVGSNVELGL